MQMKYFYLMIFPLIAIGAISCGKIGKKSKGLPDDGQVHGVAPSSKPGITKPLGMVYVPPGTFHMGPSDEDVSYAIVARNKQVSIQGFWMDATETTNNQYRQFVYWVRDSIAATKLEMTKTVAGEQRVDWAKAKTIKWKDSATIEKLDAIILPPPDRVYGKKELDPEKLEFVVEYFDLQEAAKITNKGKPRSTFMVKYNEKVYPDTLVWMRDFSYSYNEPMTQRYFANTSFGNYPVVGISWKQAMAYCNWRTVLLNSFLDKTNKMTKEKKDQRIIIQNNRGLTLVQLTGRNKRMSNQKIANKDAYPWKHKK
jgi:sulfatase modifying factor 1